MKSVIFLFALCFSVLTFGQKKVLDHKDFEIWNTIKNPSISPNGKHIMYALEKGEKDRFLKLKNTLGITVFEYNRGSNGRFTYNSKFAIFTIKPYKDSIISLKRKKVKKDKLPKDSLGIYNISTKSLTKIGNIKSYKIPEKWTGFIAYQFEEIKKEKKKKKGKSKTKKKSKKANKKNGFHLVVRNLVTQKQDTFKFVTQYTFAEKGKKLAFATSGKTKKDNAAVYVYNLETNKLQEIYQHRKAKISQLNFSKTGNKLSFIADNDSTKVQQRPNELYFWNANNSKAQKLLDNNTTPKGYKVSSDGKIRFSKDEKKLFFGLTTPTIVKDTTLVNEEIVNVEVWSYNQPRLYTVQEQQLKNDLKKSYETVIHLDSKKLVQLGTKEYPNVKLTKDANSNYALVRNPKPHQLESQWDGLRATEISTVNLTTGKRSQILPKTSGYLNISPKGKYIYGYNRIDSTWFAYNTKEKIYKTLTNNKRFYREIHDTPTPPRSYGIAGWTKDDNAILIYDRYDIWKFNPKNGKNVQLTKGRETKTVYRYVQLDKEEQNIDTEKNWLLLTFDEINKNSGYYEYTPKSEGQKVLKVLIDKPYRYSKPIKAELADGLIFTRQSFKEFPDIRFSNNTDFTETIRISDANPQQANYNWGTIELVDWTSLDGRKLKGLLVKPENFDPTKKYPMIVNFYEKRSDRLNTHWNPYPGRSTINYSFYASRGYLIFNPDIYYKDGKPGESAYNCIIPGIEMLIKKGFVDKNNIGVQGHSWGGYQIAHLVTKTDIFKCAESGAPVANMISAYGGIRWQTGLSRQFQYEHTQSRIGGTLWEYPSKYIENSPIFNIDKINTPLLIMHNDKDGHVPWYQGIEFFVALRRLGKPSWFLNYNDEPHWPLKLQNRKDFNIRMAQFFDHYLKGKPKPRWMKRGVPAIEKGVKQGYELDD